MTNFTDYFASLECQGIRLTEGQKAWYTKKAELLREGIKTQYPSTLDECWEVANEGLWYGKAMGQLRADGRICRVPYERQAEVHTAWDLGRRDPTAIWFFQVVRKEVRLIDYYENNFEDIAHYIKILKEKPYLYGRHYVPHDAGIVSLQTGKSLIMFAKDLGVKMEHLERENTYIPGINQARLLLDRCWFDEAKCAQGIKALENYRKEWSDKNGCFVEREVHDWASHGASAFRYLARAVELAEKGTVNLDDALRKHKQLTKSRKPFF